jgi:hypothetical protein
MTEKQPDETEFSWGPGAPTTGTRGAAGDAVDGAKALRDALKKAKGDSK